MYLYITKNNPANPTDAEEQPKTKYADHPDCNFKKLEYLGSISITLSTMEIY